MTFRQILVPHDFSAGANHAAALARDEALATGGRVSLLHVVDLPPELEGIAVHPTHERVPVALRHYLLGRAEEHVEDLAKRLRADGAHVAAFVEVGRPADEILRFAAEHGIDLIVMSTHGRTGLDRVVTGSVTERVVRASPVPVLTTRHVDSHS